MTGVFDAVRTFFGHLAAVDWGALGIALLLHVARLLVRAVAWRNIVAAAYPDVRVRRRGVFGAYIAGVGMNAILPARSGDLLRLYLVHRRVEGASYPTLGATVLADGVFDTFVLLGLYAWGLSLGVLPGFGSLPDIPQIDWSWAIRHPKTALVVGGVWVAFLAALGIWAAQRVREFRQRFAQGFAVFRDRRRYVRTVASWQALSWVFRIASGIFFLRAFGIDGTLGNSLLVQLAQSASTALPLTPGGAGTQQGLLVYLFRGEAPRVAVLSFSVGMQIAIALVGVVLGLIAVGLMLRTFRWRQVIAEHRSSGR